MHKYPYLIIKNTSYILYILIFQRILFNNYYNYNKRSICIYSYFIHFYNFDFS